MSPAEPSAPGSPARAAPGANETARHSDDGTHFHYLLEFCHTHPGSHEKKDPNWRNEHVQEWRPGHDVPQRDLPEQFAAFLDGRIRFGVKVGLENTRALLHHLQLDGRTPPTILVGGTNGKGTVATTLGEALSFAGYRVGVYTSPHVERFIERIQVSGGDPDEGVLHAACEAVQAATKSLDEQGIHATYFEVATALALAVFRGHRAQVLVLEVGMGGRGDAVNAVEPVASIITNVGDDHAAELGSTVEARAREKAGIMRPGKPCYTGASGAALDALRGVAVAKGAFLVPVATDDSELLPADAAEMLARSLISDASLWGALPRLRDLDATSIHVAKLPGRQEAFELPGGRVALLDVAHNKQALEALARRLDSAGGRTQDRVLLVALLGDKDPRAVADFIGNRFGHVVITRPDAERGQKAEQLASALLELGVTVQSTHDDFDAGWQAAYGLLPSGGLIVVTGSFYLVGPVRAVLRRRTAVA